MSVGNFTEVAISENLILQIEITLVYTSKRNYAFFSSPGQKKCAFMYVFGIIRLVHALRGKFSFKKFTNATKYAQFTFQNAFYLR